MAKIEDCPGFETFGSDVKAAREALNISRRALQNRSALILATLPISNWSRRFPACPWCCSLYGFVSYRWSGTSIPPWLRRTPNSARGSTTNCSSARKNICRSLRQPLTERSNWTNRGRFTEDVKWLLFFASFSAPRWVFSSVRNAL